MNSLFKNIIVGLALLGVFLPGICGAETPLRIGIYNIKFLDAEKLPEQGDRLEKLKTVIRDLKADVIGLQEIDDRTALRTLFDNDQWHLVSGDDQDLPLPTTSLLVSPDRVRRSSQELCSKVSADSSKSSKRASRS